MVNADLVILYRSRFLDCDKSSMIRHFRMKIKEVTFRQKDSVVVLLSQSYSFSSAAMVSVVFVVFVVKGCYPIESNLKWNFESRLSPLCDLAPFVRHWRQATQVGKP